MVSERKTMSIYFKKHGEIKKVSKWVFNDTFEKQEGYIDDDGFNKITCAETLKFFRSLGGTERVYKKNGKIVKLVSTKPDGTVRAIYEFRHS